MTSREMSRRAFLETSGLVSIGAATLGVSAAVVAPRGIWPKSPLALSRHEARTLLAMARLLLPPSMPRRGYCAMAVAAVDQRAAACEAVRARVRDGVATLDDAMGVDFVELSRGDRLGVVRRIEGSDFFKLMHRAIAGGPSEREIRPMGEIAESTRFARREAPQGRRQISPASGEDGSA